MKSIEVCGLSYAYKNNCVLDNICFSVEEKSTLVILGVNGSGKSTLINCLMGFLNIPPDTIKMCGKDIALLSNKERSHIVSYVSQDSDSGCSLNVYEYLSLGRIAHKQIFGSLSGEDDKIIINRAKEMLIEHLLGKKVTEISGGERQLAAITRALIQDTPVIILDEPTSALDYKNQVTFLKIIRKLNQKGKTVIFSSHNPNHALAIDANVCVINQRNIWNFGVAREVISQEMLNTIYGDNVKLIHDEKNISCNFCL